MVKEEFGMTRGLERGFAVLTTIKRKRMSQEVFQQKVRDTCVRLVKLVSDKLKGADCIGRLNLTPVSIGELRAIGAPEQIDEVVTVDARGMAKTIVGTEDSSATLLQMIREAEEARH
jgi:hypothetical protein